MTSWLMANEQMKPMVKAYINSVLTTPYLMDQLLALSAMHLSTVHLDRSDSYCHQATQLQNRALTLFNRAKEKVSDENCIPVCW